MRVFRPIESTVEFISNAFVLGSVMSRPNTHHAKANITISEPLRNRLRVEKAERGLTYDELLRLEFDFEELDSPEAT